MERHARFVLICLFGVDGDGEVALLLKEIEGKGNDDKFVNRFQNVEDKKEFTFCDNGKVMLLSQVLKCGSSLGQIGGQATSLSRKCWAWVSVIRTSCANS